MFLLITTYQIIIFALFVFLYNNIVVKNGLLNISFFHYIYYFVFYFFGAGVLYLNGGLENNLYFFSATLYPIVSVLGMYTVNTVYKEKIKNLLVIKQSWVKYVYLFTAVIILAYAATLDQIPLIYVLKGDSAAAAIARTLVTKEYGGPKFLYYLYRIIVDYLLIFIVIYEYFKAGKFTMKLGLLIAVIMIVSTLDTQKYPAVNILMMLFIAIFTHYNIRSKLHSGLRAFINYKVVFMLLIAYLAIGFLWASVSGRLLDRSPMAKLESIIESANSMVGDRLLFGQNRVLYITYETVPQKYDYFMGKTFANPLRLLPYKPVPLSYLLYDELHPESIGGEVRGAAPAVFYSVIYANFGIVVSFISMYLFGIFMQFINNYFVSEHNYMIPYRFMWLNYMTLFSLSFDTIYNSERFYFLLLIYFILFYRTKNIFISNSVRYA